MSKYVLESLLGQAKNTIHDKTFLKNTTRDAFQECMYDYIFDRQIFWQGEVRNYF